MNSLTYVDYSLIDMKDLEPRFKDIVHQLCNRKPLYDSFNIQTLIARLRSNDVTLKEIKCDRCLVYDYLPFVCDALKKNSTVRRLDLSVTTLTSAHATTVAEMLKKNSTIEVLDVEGNNNIGDEGTESLAKALEQNETLCTLDLGNIGILRKPGSSAVAEMLEKNKTLHTLILSWNNIGDEEAKELAKAIKQNRVLDTLVLKGNMIGNEGAKALAESLKYNKTIVALDLSQNNIGNSGVKALAESLTYNNTMLTLNLSQNKIGNNGKRALVDLLEKNLTIQSFGNDWLLQYDDEIANSLWRNKSLDMSFQSIFIGLHGSIGNDVYTFLLIIDQLPHYVLLNRSRKVALLQSLLTTF